VTLGRRGRLALKIVGYGLLALVTFVYAIHLTFPYGRVRDKFVESLSGTYDVTVAGVDRSLVPGRFALTGVTLASRPKAVGQPSTTMYFKRVELDLKILPLLGKRVEVGLDVRTGSGAITGSIAYQGKDAVASLKLAHVPLATLPGITDAVGLPMDGNADGKVSLRLVNGDWSKKTAGGIELNCRVGCAIGDGVTKIYPKPQRPSDAALYRDGLTVPKILLDSFLIAIDIKDGQARLRTFDLKSQDGQVEVDFAIRLARATKDLGQSTINGCIRYKCAADFQRKYPGLCIGSPIVDEQGLLNIKLSGQVGKMRRLPQRCDTGGGSGDSAGTPTRPTFDTIPESGSPTGGPTPTPLPTTTVTPTMPVPEPPPLDRKPVPMPDDVNVPPPPMPAVPPGGSPDSTGAMPPAMGGSGTMSPGGMPSPGGGLPSPGGGVPSPGGGGTMSPGGGPVEVDSTR
jgi:type II secretion system protein N